MSLVTEKLKIVELSKFGFKTTDGSYVNWGPRFTDKANLVPGVSAEFLLYVSESGKKYVNEVKSLVKTAPVVAKNAEETKEEVKRVFKTESVVEPKKFKAKDDTSMSKSDWALKDRSQLIGGLSHDAAALSSSMVNVEGMSKEEVLERYKFFLEGMLRIRDEVK